MSNRFELTDDFLAGLAEALRKELLFDEEIVCAVACRGGGKGLRRFAVSETLRKGEVTGSFTEDTYVFVFKHAASSVRILFGKVVEDVLKKYFASHSEDALKDLSGKEAL